MLANLFKQLLTSYRKVYHVALSVVEKASLFQFIFFCYVIKQNFYAVKCFILKNESINFLLKISCLRCPHGNCNILIFDYRHYPNYTTAKFAKEVPCV